MCGIVGIFRTDGQAISPRTLADMGFAIRHRGPDSDGIWFDGPAGLAHRRLSIIDLSPAGHQPMSNETSDVFIAYNGELYNHQSLRVELEAAGHQFHSRTDTEVIIHAYEQWGEGCLDRFNGMFAFVVWDGRKRHVFAARDRYGVKPLYYFCDGAKLLLASEVKAILAHPGVRRSVCLPAMEEYFTFQNIFSDLTLFEGIRLLPPGHWLSLKLDHDSAVTTKRYWDYSFNNVDEKISAPEAAEEVRRLFRQSVNRQLMSDVPLGSYLSGGMDSGSVTAVAREGLGRLATFTGGFDLSSASGLELGFDERAQAEVLSNLLKTEHYEMVLHAGDMEHVMPDLIWHLEDLRVGQCYPNYYVARLASKFVKVVLSGAGGDELFGGYPWRYERALAGGATAFADNYFNFWQRIVPNTGKEEFFNADVRRGIGGYSARAAFDQVLATSGIEAASEEGALSQCLYFELKTFLHGILLVEDKVSMAHSLETRVPFLDNDLVDFVCTLPARLKLHRNPADRSVDENDPNKAVRSNMQTRDGKLVLREAMKTIMPGQITERTKQGFSAPDASWFRGESIDYVRNLLLAPRARTYDYVSLDYVAARIEEHCSAKHNHRLFIWSLLSFEWWLKKFMP